MQSILDASTPHRPTLPVIVEALSPRPIDQTDTVVTVITLRAFGMQEIQALLIRLTRPRGPDFFDLGFDDGLAVEKVPFHRWRGAFLVLMVDDACIAILLGGVEHLVFVDLAKKSVNTDITVEEGVGDQVGCIAAGK